MAIVNDRHNHSKPVQVDPKTGKPLPPQQGAVQGRSSPTMDSMSDPNGGFFGSFFASKNKKKMAAMEPPPPSLKASGTLSEREGVEVEVISEFFFPCGGLRFLCMVQRTDLCLELLISSYYNIVRRTMIDMVPKAVMLNLVQ